MDLRGYNVVAVAANTEREVGKKERKKKKRREERGGTKAHYTHTTAQKGIPMKLLRFRVSNMCSAVGVVDVLL